MYGQLVRNGCALIDIVLRGASQVVLINNPVSGVLIITSLFFPSPIVGVHGVLGLTGATFTAMVLRLDAQALASGLFGYNGLLVGMALATFLSRDGWDAAVLVAAVVMGGVSTIFQLSLGNALVPVFKAPPLTLAFNLTFLLLLLASSSWSRFSMPHHGGPPPPDAAEPDHAGVVGVAWMLRAALVSLGQVFLCESVVSGALIVSAIAISSRIAACAAYMGALSANLLALLLGVDPSAVARGLWGYSSCLTALTAVTFFMPSLRCYAMAAVGVVLTVLFDGALRAAVAPLHMPVGTLPFCFAGLTLMLTHSKVEGFEAVPLADVSTPEDHLFSARVGRIVHAADKARASQSGVEAMAASGGQCAKGRVSRVQEPPGTGALPSASPPREVREAIVISRPGTRDTSTHGGSALSPGWNGAGAGAGKVISSTSETLHGGSLHGERHVARKLAAMASAKGHAERVVELAMRTASVVSPSRSREGSRHGSRAASCPYGLAQLHESSQSLIESHGGAVHAAAGDAVAAAAAAPAAAASDKVRADEGTAAEASDNEQARGGGDAMIHVVVLG